MSRRPGESLGMRRYLAAAVGVVAAGGITGGAGAWGQAVDPVNISGPQAHVVALEPRLEMPAGREPSTVVGGRAMGASQGGGAESMPPLLVQAVVPVDLGQSSPATTAAREPAASLPAGADSQPAGAAGGSAASTEPAPGAVAATAADGKAYPVAGIKIDYKAPNPQQPPISDLLNSVVSLGIASDGYVAPRAGVPTVRIRIGDIGKDGLKRIYRSGIATLYGSIVRYFNARSIIGVFVVVDANDIDSNDNDIRPPDRQTLQFIVVTSSVKQVRTVAIGGDSSEQDRVDNPRYNSIKNHSPLLPASATHGEQKQDLLRKDVLDDYVFRLNRQPGRHIDVAVSGTSDPGGVNLDYLVSEARPWYTYVQVSNTGTRQTNEWRERLGFVHNQLTGHDDVLSIDYMTAGFSASHAVIGSYELPFFDLDRVRYKVFGSWNEFTASDLGISTATSTNFTGDQWTAGNELIWNFFQHRELFLDLAAGYRFTGIEATNLDLNSTGHGNYFGPYLGLRIARDTELASTFGSISLISYITDDSTASLAALGRSDPDREPFILQFDFSQSAFLEPLLDTERFAAGNGTLAHELWFGTHGQYAFGNRLIAQFQDVGGGMTSVRGYPESITAGDSVVVLSGEYRFHLPRIFPVQSDPTRTPFLGWKSFRASPQQVYGHPDWDLIFRTFIDAGMVVQSEREAFENNSRLIGTGVGIELQLKQNFNLRVDWGCTLTGVKNTIDPNSDVSSGSNRFHISTTFLY